VDGNDGGSRYLERDATAIRLRGDELDRYIEFHEELYRTIRHLVFSTPETAADACSFAWLQFFAASRLATAAGRVGWSRRRSVRRGG
jgi:hypothetical protein